MPSTKTRFAFGRHIAINVPDVEKASVFYRDVLGWEPVENAKETQFRCGEMNFYLDSGTDRKVFLQFDAADLPAACDELRAAGCEVGPYLPEGGHMVRDPHGLNFFLSTREH